MKQLITAAAFILLAGFATSCYYDKEELLYGNTNAACTDTATVSYSQKLVPMLQQYCYGCHTGSFPSGNQLMGTYTADKAMAQSGKLYGTMNHATGFSPMPKGTSKMTSCQVDAVRRWIAAGMLNN